MLEIPKANNARFPVGGTAIMAGRKAFDAKHPLTATREVIERGTTHDAEPDDHDINCWHWRYLLSDRILVARTSLRVARPDKTAIFPDSETVKVLFYLAALWLVGDGVAIAEEIPLPRPRPASFERLQASAP